MAKMKKAGIFATQTKAGAHSAVTLLSSRLSQSKFSVPSLSTLKGLSKKFNKKNAPKIILPLVLFFVAIFLVSSFVKSSSNPGQSTQNEKFAVKPSLQKIGVNREFAFPINDETGKEVGDFKYVIESAELTDEIIVKGQRATSVEGRVFLIVNVKIVNNINQGIQINSRDFIRLSVNGSDERIAPDIHNDPVEAQAIAAKYTRVGFAINTSDKNPVLQVGEIGGEKTQVPLEFK